MIECKDTTTWLSTLKARYDISKTTMTESEDNITIWYEPRPNKRMLVGRYCKVQKWGVVLCWRRVDKHVDYDRRGNR